MLNLRQLAKLDHVSRRRRRTQPNRTRRLLAEELESRRLLAQTVGLFVNEPGAYEGYTLWGPLRNETVYLINNEGQQVHSWESAYPPNSNYLLEDGTLLRTAQLPGLDWGAGGSSGRVEQFDWDGNLIWSFELATDRQLLHHDIEPILAPDGSLESVLMIAWEKFTRQEALDRGRNPANLTDPANNNEMWAEMIIEVKPDYDSFSCAPGEKTCIGTGETVWEWHLWDHLVQDFDPGKPQYGNVANNPQRMNINYEPVLGNAATNADWAHFNGIDYNPQLDQIVISSRDFSEMWIIDHSTTTDEAAGMTGGNSGMGGDLLYRWGNPAAYNRGTVNDMQMMQQHNVNWIDPGLPGAGNILLFNNGAFRPNNVAPFSTVIEMTPPMAQQWFFNNKTTGEIDDLIVFSTKPVRNSWLPITGDWNGDGFDSGGYYNPNTQTWHLNNATDGTDVEVVFDTDPIGADETWLPVVGDWNGDGTDTVGLYDPAANLWYLSNGVDSWADVVTVDTQTPVPAGAIPLAGDWDKQNGDSIGFYDPQTNRWIFINDLDGSIDDSIVFQIPTPHPTWKPIIGDWNKNGKDTAGLYDPIANRWYLNNQTDGGFQDMIVINAPDAPREWLPVIGDWNNNGFDTVGLYNPAYGNYTISPARPFGPANPTWEYRDTPRGDFYSSIISGAQRLPNGNTLVDEGVTGRFFEVTRGGQIVWEYVNPVTGAGPLDQGTRPPALGAIADVRANLVFRALRYGTDYPAFVGKDLTPQGPIELYPDYYDTVGLYNPNNFEWVLNNHLDGTITDIIEFEEGLGNALPVAGDWNADGVDTVGLYFPATRTFALNNKTDGSDDEVVIYKVMGVGANATWLPIAGDWNDDGFDTVGLYDPDSNNWYLSDGKTSWSEVTTIIAPADVPSTWLPIAGNWDGMGGDSVGLYDPARNWWILNNAIDGSADPENLTVFDVGAAFPSWIPITGDWNNNGKDTVGLYDPATRRWYLNNKTNGETDDLIVFRTPGMPATALPITGDWDGTAGPPLIPAEGEGYSARRADAPVLVTLSVVESTIDSTPGMRRNVNVWSVDAPRAPLPIGSEVDESTSHERIFAAIGVDEEDLQLEALLNAADEAEDELLPS